MKTKMKNTAKAATKTETIKTRYSELKAPSFKLTMDFNEHSFFHPISARVLHKMAGEDIPPVEWAEHVVGLLELAPGEYIHLPVTDYQFEEDYAFSAAAALKIIASFDGRLGDSARDTMEAILDPEGGLEESCKHAEVRVMLEKLNKLYGRSVVLFGSAATFQGVIVGISRSAPSGDRAGQDTKIDALFREEITADATERMLEYATLAHRLFADIKAEIDDIYASDLYASALSQGLIPEVISDTEL